MAIITNEQFQLELRREIKIAKKHFIQSEQYPKVYRQWNLYKVQLKALYALIYQHPDMKLKDFEGFIRQNPTKLKFLNDCLDVLPCMLKQLKYNDYSYIFEKFYAVKRKEMNRIRDERRQNLQDKQL